MRHFIYTTIFLLLSTVSLQADYIKNAIIVCPTLDAIKAIEPHIDEDTNQILFKDGCLILTTNAKISVTKNIDDRYLKVFIHDLNSTMYTLNRGIVLEKSTGQI